MPEGIRLRIQMLKGEWGEREEKTKGPCARHLHDVRRAVARGIEFIHDKLGRKAVPLVVSAEHREIVKKPCAFCLPVYEILFTV